MREGQLLIIAIAAIFTLICVAVCIWADASDEKKHQEWYDRLDHIWNQSDRKKK